MSTTVKRRTLGLIAGLLLANLVPSSPAAAGRASWDCYRHKRSEKRFAAKMNTARSVRGTSKMFLDKQLSKVARRHARVMAADNDLFHSDMTKLSHRVTRWETLGENVGMGNTVESLHSAFMASPGHKANILYGSFRHVGVGTSRSNGTLFVTVVFEGAQNPGTTLSPPSC